VQVEETLEAIQNQLVEVVLEVIEHLLKHQLHQE
jgi:hypothetical protein